MDEVFLELIETRVRCSSPRTSAPMMMKSLLPQVRLRVLAHFADKRLDHHRATSACKEFAV